MNDKNQNHPDRPKISEISQPEDGAITSLRIGATIVLGCAALVVLALAGGSLNVTSTGVTMNVNPPR
jgi:hypothetical protein